MSAALTVSKTAAAVTFKETKTYLDTNVHSNYIKLLDVTKVLTGEKETNSVYIWST